MLGFHHPGSHGHGLALGWSLEFPLRDSLSKHLWGVVSWDKRKLWYTDSGVIHTQVRWVKLLSLL